MRWLFHIKDPLHRLLMTLLVHCLTAIFAEQEAKREYHIVGRIQSPGGGNVKQRLR